MSIRHQSDANLLDLNGVEFKVFVFLVKSPVNEVWAKTSQALWNMTVEIRSFHMTQGKINISAQEYLFTVPQDGVTEVCALAVILFCCVAAHMDIVLLMNTKSVLK